MQSASDDGKSPALSAPLKDVFVSSGKFLLFLISTLPALAQSATPLALLEQVLNALETNDTQALKAASISKGEFNRFLWPSVRRTVTLMGMTADTFYSMCRRESDAALARMLVDFKGREAKIVRIDDLVPERHPKRRRHYRAYYGPAVTIRLGDTEKSVHLVGGIIEHDGIFKVTTYSLSPDQKDHSREN